MKSAWVDRDAQATIEHYAARGIGADLALRVYTTRLLGQDPKLVLHGGGNTSVKTRLRDLLGDETEVLCVKGSGWDLADIEPPGLPAVRLAPLRRLAALPALSDEDMVNAQRINLLDAPGALGTEEMREINSGCMKMMEVGVRRATENGDIAPHSVTALTHLLYGGLCETAMAVARAEDQQQALDAGITELRGLFDALATAR